MEIKSLNKIKLKKFIESFDLALFVLQIFDPYSYNFFLQELKKNKLIFIVFNLRIQNQINLSYKTKKNTILKFLENQTICVNHLKQILIIFSKTLNMKFCKQKFNLICFYFLPEYSFFSTKLKNKNFKVIKFFDFWITLNKKRLNFFFLKLFPSNYKFDIYNYMIILYLQNGLRFINFYKNL
jgi:hypothetical protein